LANPRHWMQKMHRSRRGRFMTEELAFNQSCGVAPFSGPGSLSP
jgi:hypothetical protein